MTIWKTPPASRAVLRALVAVLFVCAMAGFVLTAVFGFEEPDNTLLLGSFGLLVTALLAIPAHVLMTRELSGPQRRIWVHELTGRGAPWAWGHYLACDDIRAEAIRLQHDMSVERGDGGQRSRRRETRSGRGA